MFRLSAFIFILVSLISVRGQDPCSNIAEQTRMQDEFDRYYAIKNDIVARKKAIELAEAFLEKYGNCARCSIRADWLRQNLPRMRTHTDPPRANHWPVAAFNRALQTRDWDGLYASGATLVDRWPDTFRGVELVLASATYENLIHNDVRWADKTLKYAKLSLEDLNSEKDFRPGYGVAPFLFKSRADAIAWMNLILGTVYVVSEKDKKASLPYLYRATLASAELDVGRNPLPYELIGDYYMSLRDERERTRHQIAERAMVAFAKAFTIFPKPQYKELMRQKFLKAYQMRWGRSNPQDIEELIKTAAATVLVDPETRVE